MKFYKIFMLKEGQVILKNTDGGVVGTLNNDTPEIVYNEMIIETIRGCINMFQSMGLIGFVQLPENFLINDPEMQKPVVNVSEAKFTDPNVPESKITFSSTAQKPVPTESLLGVPTIANIPDAPKEGPFNPDATANQKLDIAESNMGPDMLVMKPRQKRQV